MSFLAVGAGIAAVGSGYSIYQGAKQSSEARRLREGAVDPGYQVNQSLIDNARIMRERYGNYTLPGYNNMRSNVDQSSAYAFNQGIQGASSSGDVIDLAAKIAYGRQQGLNDIEMRNSQGRDLALSQYLDANARAGAEYQNQNAYDRQRYREQLMEASGLQQAGATNTAQGIGDIANIGSSLALRAYANRGDAPNNATIVAGTAPTAPTAVTPRISPVMASNTSGMLEDEYRKLLRDSLMNRGRIY